jgi:ferrochelatase
LHSYNFVIKKKGVLLINLGTPKSPSVKDVGIYLFQFLNDPRVIYIHWFFRKMLVNVLIAPFRMFSSAKEYKKLWTSEGSPLDFHSKKLRKEVQNNLPDTYTVHLAMRYQKPSIKKVLAEMKKAEYEEIIILPLYPQYAASSEGTAVQEVMK